jgi:hypothetical protein
VTTAYAITGIVLGVIVVAGFAFAWYHHRQPGE